MGQYIRQANHRTGAQTGKPAQKRKKDGRTAVVVVGLAVLAASTAGLGLYVGGLDTVYPHVRVADVDLGGLSQEEAADVLDKAGYDVYDGTSVTVSLPLDHSLTITAEEAGVDLSAADAAKSAYLYGREKGFPGYLPVYLKCLLSGADPVDTGAEHGVDMDAVRALVSDAVREVDAALMGSDLVIGEDSITVVKGAKFMSLDADEICSLIEKAFVNRDFTVIQYDPTVTGEDKLDLQSLYDTVYCEPVDAEYDPETGEATQDKAGLSFDMEQAEQLWDDAKNGDTVVIPLIVTEPSVTTDYLNSVLFRDLLGQKSTTLAGSSSARINNITKAAAAINGTVLNPGEEFSYNDVVGPRTAANGYQLAGAYSGGQVVTEYGGGICQVSSTIYYTALLSNLELTDRSCHYFGVPYLPAGLDATVSWGGPEFKFINDREYPIRIEAYTDMTSYSIVVKIWGTNLDGSYVQLTTQTWTTEDGYGAQSYRWVYDKNGTLISSEPEARSIYHYHVEESESPSPTVSPSPSPSPSASPSASPSSSPSPSSPPSTSPSTSPSSPASADPSATPDETPSVETSPAATEPVGPEA